MVTMASVGWGARGGKGREEWGKKFTVKDGKIARIGKKRGRGGRKRAKRERSNWGPAGELRWSRSGGGTMAE